MLDLNSRLYRFLNAAGLHAEVRQRLLNGQRRQVALEFELSEQELEAVMAVQAETLGGFARGLRERMGQRPSSDQGVDAVHPVDAVHSLVGAHSVSAD